MSKRTSKQQPQPIEPPTIDIDFSNDEAIDNPNDNSMAQLDVELSKQSRPPNISNSFQQNVFTINGLMTVLAADSPSNTDFHTARLVYVFFVKDHALEREYNDKYNFLAKPKQILYVRPKAIMYQNKRTGRFTFQDMKAFRTKYGNDVGLRFNKSKRCTLIDSADVNVLVISTEKQLVSNASDYYYYASQIVLLPDMPKVNAAVLAAAKDDSVFTFRHSTQPIDTHLLTDANVDLGAFESKL